MFMLTDIFCCHCCTVLETCVASHFQRTKTCVFCVYSFKSNGIGFDKSTVSEMLACEVQILHSADSSILEIVTGLVEVVLSCL